MFMLYVRVLLLCAGRLFTTDAQLESYITVATHLGGEVTFDIDGAVDSQCKTHEGRMVVCFGGTTMEGIGPEFQNRISGSCDRLILKDVQKGDLHRRFICVNLYPLKPAIYIYNIKATIAPPQTSVNGSKVNVSWKPADWQTGSILEYEVKWSCNATELLVDEITVNGTSTVLEGLPQGVWCTVSVAAVTSDGVEAWSKQKPFFIRSSGNTGTDTQSVEEGKLSLPLVVSLVSVGSLVSLAFLAILVWFLMKRHRNSVPRPQPNAEQGANSYSPVPITQPQNDEEETQV